MPAHSSNKLQPLDIDCFRSLKGGYRYLVEEKACLDIGHINKLDFLKILSKARQSAFTAENIQNSFTATGLVLFNLDRVLSKLNIQLKTSTPPDSQSTNSASKTSYTTKQLEKQATAAKRLLRKYSRSPLPLLEARLNKIIKGYELTLNELALAREEIRKYHIENEWKGQKRKHFTRQLAITESLAIQKDLERFQRENKVDKAQDTIAVDPTLSTVRPRVRAPSRCSNCHTQGHTRVRCPNPLSN